MREFIFNLFDVLDKIRFLSFIDKLVFVVIEELFIKIKVDKENNIFYVIDIGIGMIKDDLVKNLGIIVKLGISEFF